MRKGSFAFVLALVAFLSAGGLIFPRRLRQNRRGCPPPPVDGSAFQPGNVWGSIIGGPNFYVVSSTGAANSGRGPYGPSTASSAYGTSAVDGQGINAAIYNCNAAGGGTVLITGGPGQTYSTVATIAPLLNVNIWSDGAVIAPINGATFTPVIASPYAPVNYITNVSYFGIALNANANHSGFTAQAISIASGSTFGGIGSVGGSGWPSITPTNGTILLTLATGTLTGMTINGRTDSLTGPWYLTYSDTVVPTYSSATFTYTQLIDGWIANYYQNTTWIDCTPWTGGSNSTSGMGGCAFFADISQTSGGNGWKGNYVHVGQNDTVGNGYWACGFRIGSNSGRDYDNYIALVNFRVGTYYRGFDFSASSDGNKIGTVHVSVRQSYGVGMWVGSAGVGSTFAGCPDNQVDLLHVDIGGASTTNVSAIVLGNYTGNATSTTTLPAFRCGALRLDTTASGSYSNFQYDVQDLRQFGGSPTPTGVYDWDVDNEVGTTRYRSLSPRVFLTGSSSTGATLWAFKGPSASGSATPNPPAYTLEISGWIHITTYSSGSVAFTLTYTDENSTLHSAEAVTIMTEGTTTFATTAGAAGLFKIVPIRIRIKASTNVGLAFTNGSASNVFNIEGCCDWLPM